MSNFDHKKILVVQTAFIGDVILITPLIRGIVEIYPSAYVDALVIPQTKSVLANNPHLRDILTFDKRENKVKAFWQTLKAVRKKNYDLVITPHSSTTTALLLKLAGIAKRLGYDRWLAARFLTDKVPHFDDRGWHKIQKNLSLLSILSNKKFSWQTELFPTKQDRNKAIKLISARPFKDRPLIAVAPGSIWNTKRWPENHYTELITALHENHFNIVVIGSGEEAKLCNEIIASSGVEAINLAGKTSLLESAAVIEQCDIIICNDSGAMHIANAMQTDVFAFFGPTVQTIGYYPFREDDFVFELDMDCRPCGSHGGDKCPLEHHNCMKNITPILVAQKVTDRLGA